MGNLRFLRRPCFSRIGEAPTGRSTSKSGKISAAAGRFFYGAFLLMVVLLAAGCLPGSATPGEETRSANGLDLTPITAAGLNGSEWHLEDYGPHSSPTPILEETEVTVRFNNMIDMEGSAGCNSYGTDFEIIGTELMLDELHRTPFTCPEKGVMEQEEEILVALETARQIGLLGSDLVITYEGGRLLFAGKAPPPVTPLTGTKWRLAAMVKDGLEKPVLEGTSINAEFTDGRMQGASGCNGYGAEYQLDGENFSLGELVQTAQLCLDEDLMEQENDFISILRASKKFRLDGENLLLSSARSQLLLEPFSRTGSAPLRGTLWKLVAFADEGVRRPPVEGVDITLLFDGELYSGWTGCNQYSGEYTIEASTARLGEVTVTERECPDQDSGRQERELLSIFNDNDFFEVRFSQDELGLQYDGQSLIFAGEGSNSGET